MPIDPERVRQRVIETRKMRLGDITPNERNWRTHNQAQRAALEGVLLQVGWVGAVLAYRSERNQGQLTFLDGHLRQEENPDLEVPVLISDLTDEEADLILATHDPISALAGADPVKLDALLSDLTSVSPGVQNLLTDLAEKVGLYQDAPPPANSKDDQPDDFPTFDNDIDTEYCCPKCSYRWSGKPK